MITKYTSLKVRLFFLLLIKGKISARKLINFVHCYIAYFCKLIQSSRSPFLINFELSNNCNENCVFCRNEKGEIFNQNSLAKISFIPKGNLKVDILDLIIENVGKYLLLAVPYVNGEPFIYKKLDHVLDTLRKNKVGSIISTNGILLNEENIDKIIINDLDLIKIHVSGFTNQTHQIQHRVGDIDVIKMNLELLSNKIRSRKHNLIVVIDYILYEHNKHELELFKVFTKNLGFIFNIRPGNPHGMEDTENKQPETSAQHIPCDWLWKALTIDWNGDLFPCCDHVVWSKAEPYANFGTNTFDVIDIWNGPRIKKMRLIHKTTGRSSIPICANCNRKGIEYKF